MFVFRRDSTTAVLNWCTPREKFGEGCGGSEMPRDGKARSGQPDTHMGEGEDKGREGTGACHAHGGGEGGSMTPTWRGAWHARGRGRGREEREGREPITHPAFKRTAGSTEVTAHVAVAGLRMPILVPTNTDTGYG